MIKTQLNIIKEASSLRSTQRIEIYEITFDLDLFHSFPAQWLQLCISSLLSILQVFIDLYQSKSDQKMILCSQI